MLRATLLLAGAACLAHAAKDPVQPLEDLFAEFEKAFGRTYESAAQRVRRFGVFAENLGHIAQMTTMDHGAEYSHMTPFADWTIEEFKARNTLRARYHDAQPRREYSVEDLPTEWDWRAKGAVNPVKNQGQCGSCWTFATVANIEGVNQIKTGKLVSLSEQELVDCATHIPGEQGCKGGLPSRAYTDMIENRFGLETEQAYPYTAADGACQAQQSQEQVFISNWTAISQDEDQIAAALVAHGPLALGINAGPMQWYKGGIAAPWRLFCNPAGLDHAVVLVGFGEEDGKKYWIIRNSWGTTWGEEGYYRIVRGKGACGLNQMVTTALMDDGAASQGVVV